MTCGYQPADNGSFDIHVAFAGYTTDNNGQCTLWNTGAVTRTIVYKVLCPEAAALAPGLTQTRVGPEVTITPLKRAP